MPNSLKLIMATAGVSKGGVTDEGSLYGAGPNVGGGARGGAATSTMSATVDSSTNWTQIQSLEQSGAGIKSDGTLWTWGSTGDGQSDRNIKTPNTSVPTQVGSLTDWSFISGSNDSRRAIKTGGTIWAFGRNEYGTLGDGTVISRSSPVQLGSLTTWATCGGAGTTGYAIKTDGTLWAWGANGRGYVGDGTVINRSSPVQIGSLTNWSYIAGDGAGGNSAVAGKTDNTLWTWGGAWDGRLGQNNAIEYSSPVQVGSLTDWGNTYGKLTLGNAHVLSVKTDGTLWGFGKNENGELGDGTVISRSSPIQIGSKTDWVICAAGTNHSMAINDTGQLWGWGINSGGLPGRIGDGTTINRSSPVQIGTATSWGGVSGGYCTIGFRTA